jgi:hypothetical protein
MGNSGMLLKILPEKPFVPEENEEVTCEPDDEECLNENASENDDDFGLDSRGGRRLQEEEAPESIEEEIQPEDE